MFFLPLVVLPEASGQFDSRRKLLQQQNTAVVRLRFFSGGLRDGRYTMDRIHARVAAHIDC